MLLRVLLAVEPPALAARLITLLESHDLGSIHVATRARLWKQLNRNDFDFVFVGRGLLPDPADAWIASVRKLPEQPEVVVLTGSDDAQERALLLGAGCIALFDAGWNDRELGDAIRALVERRRSDGTRILRDARTEVRYSLDDFVSESPVMRQFLEVSRRVVDSYSSLLILGETGVGKERLARAVHQEGRRAPRPFLAVHCGALPETRLESELFGHEQGALTGATRARPGYFELAHEGTLFLDEIGEMPLHLQVKLLRVLEDRRVLRLGGERAQAVDVRVVAATHRDLEAEVRAHRFRADLYYRLAVVTLTLPPLRERREDIPQLVHRYLQHFAVQLGRPVLEMDADAIAALVRYPWPGNVRELINVLERAVLLSPGPGIGAADLPRAISGLPRAPGERPPAASSTGAWASMPTDWAGKPLARARREVVEAFTRAYLAELLRASRGRVGETARRAGVNERSLYDLMRRHGLRKEDYRSRPSS